MLTALLYLFVFINGATDASNSVSAAVSSRAVSVKLGLAIAATAELIGVLTSGVLFPSVGNAVAEIAILPSRDLPTALGCAVAVSAAWSAIAWRMALPTSESHGLLSAVAGVSAVPAGMGKSASSLLVVIWSTVISVTVAAVLGAALSRLARNIGEGRRLSQFQRAAVFLTSIMHGAQDGAKFIALLALASPTGGRAHTAHCAVILAVGTAVGGKRIIKNITENMVHLDRRSALASDVASALSLFALSLFGMPLSTTHTKNAAMIGATIARGDKPDGRETAKLAAAWVATFPVCFGMGYLAYSVITSI